MKFITDNDSDILLTAKTTPCELYSRRIILKTNTLIDTFESKPSMFGLWVGLGLLAFGLCLYPWALGSSYQSSSDFHAAMEIFGSILGIAAGSVFLVQFYTSGKRFYLLIGLAFLLNGGEDMMHGLFASGTFDVLFGLEPAHAKNFIPATYVTGRLIFGLLLLTAPFLPTKHKESENPKRETRIALLIAFPLTMILTALVYSLNVPRFMHPELIISRPVDLISAFILMFCAFAYIVETRKSIDAMANWILISIFINIAGQLQMSFSKELFDAFFDIGHIAKILGYTVPLFFMAVNQISTIQSLDQVRHDLAESNASLETRLSAIAEHDIVAQTNASGKIVAVNEAFIKISGYSEKELIGQDHRLLNSGTHPKAFFIGMWKAISSGQVWKGQICNRAKDGSLYWTQSTIVPMMDAGGRTQGYLAVRTDITQVLSAQAMLQEKNEELERFVYVASHDLKSPLVTIQGFVGFLVKNIKNGKLDRLEEFAARIDDGAQKMQMVIDDLLEISRVGSDATPSQQLNINELSNDVVDLLKGYQVQSGAIITVDENLPFIHCNPVHIRQVFQNLISNAMKYGQVEGQQLNIRVSASIQGNEVLIQVADNGPGIDKKYRDKVFELFSRLESTQEGTGIGLAIVKRIADAHSGKLWIEDTPGGGATFVLSLPRIHIDPTPGLANAG